MDKKQYKVLQPVRLDGVSHIPGKKDVFVDLFPKQAVFLLSQGKLEAVPVKATKAGVKA